MTKNTTIKIVILGAGSVGCYIGGCLIAAGANVSLVGRARLQQNIAQHGLRLTDWEQRNSTVSASDIHFTTDNNVLAEADFILLCVKSLDTESAAVLIKQYASADAVVVSFQNGVGNGELLQASLHQTVLKGMVPFNIFYQGEGHFHCGTQGHLAIEDAGSICQALVTQLHNATLPVDVYDDLTSVQYGKLIINLNNAVNALSGIPLQQQLGNRDYRNVVAAIQKEALVVLKAKGITPARLGKVIPTLMPYILSLPNGLFKLVAASTLKIDPQARSSMYEDLQLNRPTEIDFLNGEIVRLGKQVNIQTPVNSHITALVKHAEQSATGSPHLSAAELMPARRPH
ncbi:2-dehydropantoate 2-reductase [Alteromonas sp. A081]|uniref:2-dehydropantoate 2-reductase n=1 Tax=Alteromonas sp. A081 TaxID=3410269 RepID=UPI003B97EE1C